MKTVLAAIVALSFISPMAFAEMPPMAIEQTVVKKKIAEDVSMDDAIASMKLRANMHNMKLVGHLPLSKQVESMGKKATRMEIFQFCDPLTAQRMVEANIHFAAYLPCRIAVVEDKKGQGWLVMMNLDLMINGTSMSPELKTKAEKVRDVLNDIMQAGVDGDL